jgi:hypothetical protein
MQQFNPTKKGEALAVAKSKEIDAKRHGKKMRRIEGGKFNSSEHLYSEEVGGKFTGEQKVMLGRVAQLINKQNVIKFGSGEHNKLIQWIWSRAEEKKIDDAVEGLMDRLSINQDQPE